MVLPIKVRTSPIPLTGEHSLWRPLWNTTHSCISHHQTGELNLAMWSSVANKMIEVCGIPVCFPLDLHDPVTLATWANWETQGVSRQVTLAQLLWPAPSCASISPGLPSVMKPSLVIVYHCVWNEGLEATGMSTNWEIMELIVLDS